MVILSSPTGFLEIAIFLLAVVGFVVAMRFFMNSRKRLRETFPNIFGSRNQLQLGVDRSGFLIPKVAGRKPESLSNQLQKPLRVASQDNTKEDIKDLRSQLLQQRQELARALQQISSLNQNESFAERSMPAEQDWQEKIEQLLSQLDKKDAEIQRLKEQNVYTQKLDEQLEAVQAEFDKLQQKMLSMEKQAWQAAELNIQLEHAEQLQLQTEKTLAKKEERLRELTLENQQLQEACNELEEKLSEVNLQRQQLTKKVQLLESLNADMLSMAESNQKLKTEISRMAELESMLQLMTERRK